MEAKPLKHWDILHRLARAAYGSVMIVLTSGTTDCHCDRHEAAHMGCYET